MWLVCFKSSLWAPPNTWLKTWLHDAGTKETSHIEREKYILVGGSWLQNWSHRLTWRRIIYSIYKIIKLTILCLTDGGCYYCFIEISHRFKGVPPLHRNSVHHEFPRTVLRLYSWFQWSGKKCIWVRVYYSIHIFVYCSKGANRTGWFIYLYISQYFRE